MLLSSMHPIAQMLNFDDLREYQERGTEHFNASIHVADAPIIDKNTDEQVVDFIDRYITCYLLGPDYNFEFYNLVKTLQVTVTQKHVVREKVLLVDLVLLGHSQKEH